MPETVSILNETRVPLPVAPGVSREFIALTYAAGGMFPRIVYIDPAVDSPAERKRAIGEDLKAARAQKATTLEI